jgi:hypothetical protein
MRRALLLVAVLAGVVFVVVGCPLPGTGVTITGSMLGYYFYILDEVQVTVTQGDASVTLLVPVTSDYNQQGAFAVANLLPGDYSIVITFAADNASIDSSGTTYSVDGGAYVPVDDETVTGSTPPYTHTITIDSLPVPDGVEIDIYLGNVE